MTEPEFSEQELIYDWNVKGDIPPYKKGVTLDDETLRDGLQSPSVTHPTLDEKLELLHLMDELGMEVADLGIPGAGPRFAEEAYRLAKEIADHDLHVQPDCAGRTMKVDVDPIIDLAQRVGIPVEASLFIGSSPIRQYAEGWGLDKLLRLTEEAVTYATENGLNVMYVTEDTTRANPEAVRKLYTTAIEAGAKRVCVCDTVGHATPEGVHNLVSFVKQIVDESGEDVKIDWHGHRDRGLGVINSLAAAAAGADRLHGTALGIGERAGNAPMDLLLVNLKLLGLIDQDLTKLPEYCELVSRICQVPLPLNYPVVGEDAFRTATGVHAAAVIKALSKGEHWLADRVYCGVPAGMVGRRQGIEVGPMSGESNVRFWLQSRNIEFNDSLVTRVLDAAKASHHILSEGDIMRIVWSGERRAT